MLDIHQLNVFLTAAETLNFTQAARKLHITQPSVSQRIQALERHFNDKLFVRSGRNLELTEAGLALLPLAREAVKLSVRIEETMESLHGQVYGHLQVGCSTTPGKYVLPHILARFHHKYPQVRVSCTVTSQSAAQRMLSDGDVHFALSSMRDSFDPEIDYSKFICDSVILIAPLDHPWADKGCISPEDLYQGEFIMREADSGTYTAMRDALSEFDMPVRDLHTLLTLGNSEAIALAVQEGLGVAFISEMVYDRLSEGKVARIDITGIEIVRDIYIARHMRRATTLAQNAFWDFIHSDDNPLQCLELGAATSN
jgi:DNA-binding transcriptional LysR family regulator